MARGTYKIPLPALYATHGMFIEKDGGLNKEEYESRGVEFNKRQRGHQHMFENVSDAYGLMMLCGIFYPKYAAQWGVAWIAGTLLYGIGYAKQPNFRLFGEALYIPANIAWIYGLYCAGTAVWNSKPL